MRILFILSRFPYPLEKGDKLRAYHQLINLSKKHEILLFALSDKKVENECIAHIKQFCAEVEIFYLSELSIAWNLLKCVGNDIPFQVAYFYSSQAQCKVNELVRRKKPSHIFCQLIRTAEYAKAYTDIVKTLDYMDVFSKGIERRLSYIPFYLTPIYKSEQGRLARYEKNIFNSFENKIIISTQDRNLLPHTEKGKIHVISNGVDTDYFKPAEQPKEFDILFNGNMNYPPNIESAEYLVHEIIPLVRKKHPEVSVLISGTNPARRILALQSEQIKVSGWTNDVRENFSKSKMLVAPMFLSIGLQNKLLEAMAMQIPCITSTLANNALGAVAEKSILIADTPEEYADCILRLLNDEKKVREIALEGYSFVLENYNWEKETEKLEKILLSLQYRETK